MSTRCVVKVINNGRSMEMYHHCDGYPEGIGFFLLKEMEKVKDEKQYEYQHSDSMLTKWVIDYHFQPTLSRHGDIEFYYEFNMDKKWVNGMAVDCWEANQMKIIQNYSLSDYYKKHKEEDVNLYYGEE